MCDASRGISVLLSSPLRGCEAWMTASYGYGAPSSFVLRFEHALLHVHDPQWLHTATCIAGAAELEHGEVHGHHAGSCIYRRRATATTGIREWRVGAPESRRFLASRPFYLLFPAT